MRRYNSNIDIKLEENTFEVDFWYTDVSHDPLATGDSPCEREMEITKVVCDGTDITDEMSDSFSKLLLQRVWEETFN